VLVENTTVQKWAVIISVDYELKEGNGYVACG
jgi:hypothetical protein